MFYGFGKAKCIPCLGFTGSQRTVSHNITHAISTVTQDKSPIQFTEILEVKSGQTALTYSPVKSHKHMPWKLYSHILDILSFPLLISVSSSFLLFWRASLEIRDHWPYGSTRDPHTHTVCAHKACVTMKNARGGDSQKSAQ